MEKIKVGKLSDGSPVSVEADGPMYRVIVVMGGERTCPFEALNLKRAIREAITLVGSDGRLAGEFKPEAQKGKRAAPRNRR